MSLDWTKPILEQSNNDRITLQTAKLMCTIVLSAKLMTKSMSVPIKVGQLQSPSMEYCYLSLNFLNGEPAYYWIPPSIPVFSQFRLPNNVLVLISSPMWWEALQVKSLVPKNPVLRPMNRPWIQTYWPVNLECTGPLYLTHQYITSL